MQIKDIADYSQQMFQELGPRAIAVAAERAQQCEADGDKDGAATWRKVEAALLLKRGPHQG